MAELITFTAAVMVGESSLERQVNATSNGTACSTAAVCPWVLTPLNRPCKITSRCDEMPLVRPGSYFLPEK